MKEQEKLTPDLWKLYRLIEERTENGLKTSVSDIVGELSDIYHFKALEGNYSNCPRLYKDIDIINASCEVDKIIIKRNNDFKLATEEEAKTYADGIYQRAMRLLAKWKKVCDKEKLDGQAKIVNNQNNQTDISKDLPIFESFIN